jgi:hypothetical protein
LFGKLFLDRRQARHIVCHVRIGFAASISYAEVPLR